MHQHTYIHAYIHKYIHACMHASTYIHTSMHAYTRTYVHTDLVADARHAYMYACESAVVCHLCPRVCVCVYVHERMMK